MAGHIKEVVAENVQFPEMIIQSKGPPRYKPRVKGKPNGMKIAHPADGQVFFDDMQIVKIKTAIEGVRVGHDTEEHQGQESNQIKIGFRFFWHRTLISLRTAPCVHQKMYAESFVSIVLAWEWKYSIHLTNGLALYKF